MEDYSSNEKVKPEKQIRCICFLVSMYTYLCVMYVYPRAQASRVM